MIRIYKSGMVIDYSQVCGIKPEGNMGHCTIYFKSGCSMSVNGLNSIIEHLKEYLGACHDSITN